MYQRFTPKVLPKTKANKMTVKKCDICPEGAPHTHDTRHHICKYCNGRGHARWMHKCDHCTDLTHTTLDHKCDVCGECHSRTIHECKTCKSVTHETKDHPCSVCKGKGHDKDMHCTFCNGIHKAVDHICETCGEKGHSKDIEHCTFCKSIDHKAFNHKCSVCGTKSHEGVKHGCIPDLTSTVKDLLDRVNHLECVIKSMKKKDLHDNYD